MYFPAGLQTYTLQSSVSSTQTTITLSSFKVPVSGEDVTMALMNTTIAYGTIAPRTSQSEFISFTGITQNADGTATLTGVTRGLDRTYPYTTDNDFKLPHAGNSKFILSDAPQVFNKYSVIENDETITGIKTFSQTPVSTAGLPVNSNQLATKQYVDNTATGTTSINRTVVSGTAGETIAVDQLVYMKASDGRWWLADADSAASSENVQLGIAQGAGTAGNTITNGVLIQGLNTFSALTLTADTKYYVSNTAGGFSITPGTNEVTVGQSQTTTTFLFTPRNDQQITENQQDALAGTSGTPSASNLYVTNDDTATAATANKIARRLATGDVTVPATPTNTTDAASKAYVDAGYTMTIPLGESFTGATTPQPCFVVNDLWQPLVSRALRMGITSGEDATGGEQVACKFTPQAAVTATTIFATIFKVNAPTDNILIEIQTDTAGSPSGTPVSNGTSNGVAGTGLSTTTPTYQTFTFASAFTLTANTPYWVVFKRSSTLSNTDYYAISSYDTSSDYASFVGKYYNGTTWSSSQLPTWEMIPSAGSGSLSLWQSDANATIAQASQFEGFCTTTGSAGASGTLIQTGNVAGFSSLIPFANYYVSTTKGAITTTANGIPVGTPVSATSVRVPTSKVGTPMPFGQAAATFGIGNCRDYIIKIPYNGTLVYTNASNGDGVTIRVASDTALTQDLVIYYGEDAAGEATTITIPVRKGQYMKPIITTGSLTGSLIPEY